MRLRTVALAVPVAVLAVLIVVLAVLAVLPRSVIGDLAYPPPTPLPAQPGCPVSTESDPLCIVVLGDSTAAGVPLEGDDRWWVRMEDALAAALPDRQVAVANWAIPRSRVDVLESAANDQPALESFDIAIVLEGVNDVGRTPVDEWSKRYEAAVEQLEARGLDVGRRGTAGELRERRPGASARRRRLKPCARWPKPDRPVLDIAARYRADGDEAAASYYADNLHQSEAGQQVIAEMATSVVLGLVGDGKAEGTR